MIDERVADDLAEAFEAGYSIGYRQAQRDIRNLIERDKPKKPVDDDCPSCNLLLMGNYDFCPQCGQRLIWEDDENES